MEDEWDKPRPVPPAPVKEGQTLSILLIDVGPKGDIYGKINGFVVFVKGATSNDLNSTVSAEITKVSGRFAFARKI